MTADTTTRRERAAEVGAVFDAIVVGAGFAGMYMLHRLRGLGFSARGVRGWAVASAAPGTGTGIRARAATVESMQYSFSFSEELDQEWNWSEKKYAPQGEILSYANHVADRFDLRRHIVFDTRVTAATFDEEARCWHIETDRGDRVRAKFCIMRSAACRRRTVRILPVLRIFADPSITPANGRIRVSTSPGCASASSAPAPRRSSRFRLSRSRLPR